MYSDQLDEALKIYTELCRENPQDWEPDEHCRHLRRASTTWRSPTRPRKAKKIGPDNLEIRYRDAECEG